MKKRKSILALALMIGFLASGIDAYAMECPYCKNTGMDVQCISRGEHLWDHISTHTKQYSSGGVLYTETCTITASRDREWWECPRGHGTITSRVRYKEYHTCDYCTELDYYE